MDRSILYRFFSLTMVGLLLFGSSGLNLDMHFCQGKLKRINLLGKAKTCAEMQYRCQNTKKQCHKSNTSCASNGDHKDCCNNEGFLLNLEFEAGDLTSIEWQTVSNKSFNLPSNQVPDLVTLGRTESKNYERYKPPILTSDIQLLVQSFLI